MTTPDSAVGEPAAPTGRHHEPGLRRTTRINLRPIASPIPLGFYAVAIASVIVGCLQLGLFEDGVQRAAAFTVLPAVAMYAAFALMLEDIRGREVLPVGRSGPAHTAVEGNLTVQLCDLERQAGVRRTL